MKKIICYGDSNTWGYDPSSMYGDSYQKPWTDLLKGYDVINCGQNGREIPVHKAQWESVISYVKSEEPVDLFIIMLGTNDLLMHGAFQAEDVRGRMDRFLHALRNSLPDLKILLISPCRMDPGTWVQEERLIREPARLGIFYHNLSAKYQTAFADAGKWEIPLAYDGVHMSEEGHRIFAQHLNRVLNEILK